MLFLDKMVGEGTFLKKAPVTVPTCFASRATLMTGLTQNMHGRLGYEDSNLWDYFVTLVGEFSKNG